MKRNHIICLFCLSLSLFLCANATAGITYTGSLSVNDGGLTAFDEWNQPNTVLSWVVDDETTPGLWHYEYTLCVDSRKAISHMIVETSGTFTENNLYGSPSSLPANWIYAWEIDTHRSGPGNTGMPTDLYGIKFDANLDATTVTIAFDSDRVPVWGDFYAKDGLGGAVHLYNTGFAYSDPTTEAQSGSQANHLLVPDTVTTVPAPGAFFLAGIGTSIVGWMRKRRRL